LIPPPFFSFFFPLHRKRANLALSVPEPGKTSPLVIVSLFFLSLSFKGRVGVISFPCQPRDGPRPVFLLSGTAGSFFPSFFAFPPPPPLFFKETYWNIPYFPPQIHSSRKIYPGSLFSLFPPLGKIRRRLRKAPPSFFFSPPRGRSVVPKFPFPLFPHFLSLLLRTRGKHRIPGAIPSPPHPFFYVLAHLSIFLLLPLVFFFFLLDWRKKRRRISGLPFLFLFIFVREGGLQSFHAPDPFFFPLPPPLSGSMGGKKSRGLPFFSFFFFPGRVDSSPCPSSFSFSGKM